MDLKAHTTVAKIYGLYLLLSAVVVFILFKLLPSDASAEGTVLGVKFTASGAFAALFVIFLGLHFVVSKAVKSVGAPRLSGNVFDDQDNPVGGAKVWLEGQNIGDAGTNINGWFEVEVKDRPPWTLRASKEGYEDGTINIDANQQGKPVRIRLKKNSTESRAPS